MPFKSDDADAAVGLVFATLSVAVSLIRIRSTLQPNTSAATEIIFV
jgi:hypothetical protein